MTDRVAIRRLHGRSGTRPDPGWGPAGVLLQSHCRHSRRGENDARAADHVRPLRSRSFRAYSPSSANPLKMLRYQQQFTFFDMARVNESVRYVNLSQEMVNGTLEKLLARIVQEVETTNPGVVIVDSFRTVAQAAERAQNGDLDLQSSCSNWPSGSPAGKRRRFSSASMTLGG